MSRRTMMELSTAMINISRDPTCTSWDEENRHINFTALTVVENSLGNFSPAMGARNLVGIGLSYRPASLCSLATQIQTRFLESIPLPIAGLKFSTQIPTPFCTSPLPALFSWCTQDPDNDNLSYSLSTFRCLSPLRTYSTSMPAIPYCNIVVV
jgi:hypothetical protein